MNTQLDYDYTWFFSSTEGNLDAIWKLDTDNPELVWWEDYDIIDDNGEKTDYGILAYYKR